MRFSIKSKTAGSRSRIVPFSTAESGSTFVASPAWNCVTETTAFSSDRVDRDVMVCSACTTALPARTASTPAWGCDAWQPLPLTVTVNSDTWAMSAPGLTWTSPSGNDGQLWKP